MKKYNEENMILWKNIIIINIKRREGKYVISNTKWYWMIICKWRNYSLYEKIDMEDVKWKWNRESNEKEEERNW